MLGTMLLAIGWADMMSNVQCLGSQINTAPVCILQLRACQKGLQWSNAMPTPGTWPGQWLPGPPGCAHRSPGSQHLMSGFPSPSQLPLQRLGPQLRRTPPARHKQYIANRHLRPRIGYPTWRNAEVHTGQVRRCSNEHASNMHCTRGVRGSTSVARPALLATMEGEAAAVA